MIISVHLHCDGRRRYDCINIVYSQYVHTTDALPGDALTALSDTARRHDWTLRAVGTDTWDRIQAWCPSCYMRLLHDTANDIATAGQLRDLLLCVNIHAPLDMIHTWDAAQRQQAHDWATREHLNASDNDIARTPKPEFLP